MHRQAAETPSPTARRVDVFGGKVSSLCLLGAAKVERVLDQLGEYPDRVTQPRGGGIAFIFLAGDRNAMLETDEEGTTVALLSDRAVDSEADAWVVDSGGLTTAVRRIVAFVGQRHAAHR